MGEVDAFVRRYAAPVLTAAGHRNRGSTYVVDGPHGRQGIVEFRSEVAERPMVNVRYGVATPAHGQFRESRGIAPEAWPPVESSLLYGQLASPEFARAGTREWIPPDLWVLGDDEHTAEVGVALARALEHEMLPGIESWFHPETLVETLKRPPRGTFPGLAPRARAVAVALIDVDGAAEELAEILERLPPDDMVRRWIEDRLPA
jgi:hypothetical protein